MLNSDNRARYNDRLKFAVMSNMQSRATGTRWSLEFYATISQFGLEFYATISQLGRAFYATIPWFSCARLDVKWLSFLARL